MVKVVDFKAPKDSCLYCGCDENHPGFTCPRISTVTHWEGSDSHPGAITLEFIDEWADAVTIVDDDPDAS